MIWLWIIALTAPPIVALMLTADEPTRIAGRVLAPWTALPALAIALFWPEDHYVRASWFLLDTLFGLDASARLLMLLTAGLWTVAAFFARVYTAKDPKRDRFSIFFLLAMTGNFGLVGTFDIAGFYMFFALMTFAAFGLVVHEETTLARFASRVYISMALIGEAALLLGLLMAAHAAPEWDIQALSPALATNDLANVIIALLLVGFGIKAGAILLHMWLPLAHPAAPVPASAVLSGAMIKAGLIGWLRFFSGGENGEVGLDAPVWGAIILLMGILAAFYGVVLGIVQRNPKTNLAYSSISQMGYMSAAVGIGLIEPALWPYTVMAAAIYALHHGLAKGTLFLGVGVAQHAVGSRTERWALLCGLGIAAAAMAGAPLTSGYLAKAELKAVAAELPRGWYLLIDILLPIASIGTTLLMGRFLWLVYRKLGAASHGPQLKRGLWRPWLIAVAMVLVVPWAAIWWYDVTPKVTAPHAPAKVWAGSWPMAIGIVVIAISLRLRISLRPWKVFPGDILVVFHRTIRLVILAWGSVVIPTSTRLQDAFIGIRNKTLLRLGRWMAAGEMLLVRLGSGGVMFVVLVLLLLVTLILIGA